MDKRTKTLSVILEEMAQLDVSKGKDYITYKEGTYKLSNADKQVLRDNGYWLQSEMVRWVEKGFWVTGYRLHVNK